MCNVLCGASTVENKYNCHKTGFVSKYNTKHVNGYCYFHWRDNFISTFPLSDMTKDEMRMSRLFSKIQLKIELLIHSDVLLLYANSRCYLDRDMNNTATHSTPLWLRSQKHEKCSSFTGMAFFICIENEINAFLMKQHRIWVKPTFFSFGIFLNCFIVRCMKASL